jgi:hypothetical protein
MGVNTRQGALDYPEEGCVNRLSTIEPIAKKILAWDYWLLGVYKLL